MFKKILVPLDGSTRAEAVLSIVEDLACDDQHHVILLQVVEPQFIYPDIHGHSLPEFEFIAMDAEKNQAEIYMKDKVAALERKNISAKYLIDYGSVAHRIIQVAQDENVDLIAMASHGRTGLAHVFYGSVAASVLHLVDRPLLLVRA